MEPRQGTNNKVFLAALPSHFPSLCPGGGGVWGSPPNSADILPETSVHVTRASPSDTVHSWVSICLWFLSSASWFECDTWVPASVLPEKLPVLQQTSVIFHSATCMGGPLSCSAGERAWLPSPPPSPLIDLWFCRLSYIINLIFYRLLKKVIAGGEKGMQTKT